MNDPHVELLVYSLVTELPNDEFADSARLQGVLADRFDFELTKSRLVVRPRDHFATEAAARAEVEPLLEDWAGAATLHAGGHLLRFDFGSADVIDRNPTPGVVALSALGNVTCVASATITRRSTKYPEPEPLFRSSPTTARLIARYKRFRQRGETLLNFANYVLTTMEHEFGGRKEASRALAVDFDVLRKLGEMCAIDDPTEGRKAGGGPKRNLTHSEREWIEAVAVALIRRAGDVRGSSALRMTLTDLPHL